MAKVIQPHFEYCAICKKRIAENQTGKLYCAGHSLYELALKLKQVSTIQLNLFKEEVK